MTLINLQSIKITCDTCKKTVTHTTPEHESLLPKNWIEIEEETYGRDRWDTYMRQTGRHKCPKCSKKKGNK